MARGRDITLCGLTVLATLWGGVPATAQQWGRPREPIAGVCFYEDINFGGRFFCANVGATVDHVPGGADDEISSIRVFGSAEVIVFRDSNFQGSSRRFDSNVNDLTRSGWNDRVTSYRVAVRGYGQGGNWGGAYGAGSYGGGGNWGNGGNDRGGPMWGRPSVPSAGACFYEDINFAGRYFCVRLGESEPRVPGGTDDEISSIQIFGRSAVTVFRDGSFQGASRRFDNSVNDLRNSGWNDRITSLRVAARGFGGGNWGGAYGGGGFSGGGASDGGLDAFADISFRGRKQTFYGNTPDVGALGMGGAISSLRVPAGGMWQVCTEPNYRGRCQVVSSDMPDLRRGDWNDAIASARRLR